MKIKFETTDSEYQDDVAIKVKDGIFFDINNLLKKDVLEYEYNLDEDKFYLVVELKSSENFKIGKNSIL